MKYGIPKGLSSAAFGLVIACAAIAVAPAQYVIIPTPSLTGLSPSSVPAGTNGLSLTVTGSNFLLNLVGYQSIVFWNGKPLTTGFNTSHSLTATVPAYFLASRGSASIMVQNCAVSGGVYDCATASNAMTFWVTLPTPTVSSLSPSSTAAETNGLTLTVSGTGFLGDPATDYSLVTWNGALLSTTFVNATTLSATVPANLLASPGAAAIKVQQCTGIGVLVCGLTSNTATFTITVPTPVISSLGPSSVVACRSGFSLAVIGSGFLSSSTVRWNSTPLVTTFISATELRAAVPANLLYTPADIDITVVQTDSKISNAKVLQVVPPYVGSISPNTAVAGGPDFDLTVNGSNFLSGALVRWNNTPLQTTFVSSTQLLAVVPANLISSAGTAYVSVANPCGAAGASRPFTITPSLAISSLSPNTLASCGPSFELTVNGTAFVSGSVVRWGGTALVTTFVSSTQLRASVPASLISTSGVAAITVLLPGGGVSNIVNITIKAPTISTVAPRVIPAGSPELTLTVDGSHFASGTTVQWNNTVLQTAFVNSTRLTAVLPASLISAPGQGLVSVANPCGEKASGTYTVTVSNSAAVITNIYPGTRTACSGSFNIVITGSGFVTGAVVRWANTPLETMFVSSVQLQANVPASLTAAAATTMITVALPGGVISNSVPFVLTGSNVTSVTPLVTQAGSPAFSITFTGTGFIDGMEVRWNGAALQTTFLGATQLSAAVPASLVATPGTASITIVNPCGLSMPVASFTIAGTTAALTAISPSAVASCGPGFTLTVNGSGFLQGAAVRWGSSALPTSSVSSTQLTAVVAASLIVSSGPISISVLNPGGGTSNASTLTVGGPAISSINPVNAVAGSGAFSMTVNGANFGSGTQVRWNGTPLQTSFVSASQLTATIPADLLTTPGTASITVSTSCGGASASALFTIRAPDTHTIVSLSPTTVPVCAPGFSLAVNGLSFPSTSQVVWASTPLQTVFTSPTRLTADVPSALLTSSARVPITVRDSGGVASNAAFFDVRGPSVTSIAPDRVQAGSSAFTLTVHGVDFTSGMSVLWGATSLPTTFNSTTRLSAAVPASLLAASGSVAISVVTGCAGSSNSAPFTVAPPPVTQVTVGGLPATTSPAQQHQPAVSIAEPYPLPLTGEATLAFNAASDLVNLPANFTEAYQQVQFASGGRVATFTIPAGSTRAELPMIQTGTVAGRISVSVTSLRQGNAPLTLPTTPVQTAEISGAAPRITDLQVTRNTTGFELRVVGDSCVREVSEVLLTFRGPSGSGLQTLNLSIPATTQFGSYFAASNSSQFGGTYRLTIQFTIQGEQNAVNGVTVALRNRTGTSAVTSANF